MKRGYERKTYLYTPKSLPTLANPVIEDSVFTEFAGDSFAAQNVPGNIRVYVKFDLDDNDWLPVLPDERLFYDYQQFKVRLKYLLSSQKDLLLLGGKGSRFAIEKNAEYGRVSGSTGLLYPLTIDLDLIPSDGHFPLTILLTNTTITALKYNVLVGIVDVTVPAPPAAQDYLEIVGNVLNPAQVDKVCLSYPFSYVRVQIGATAAFVVNCVVKYLIHRGR